MEINMEIDGLDSFKKAILNCPEFTVTAVQRFLTQSMAALNRVLIRNPWKLGEAGGGIPISTRNLIDNHIRREINIWDLLIQPTASYTKYVHEGTRKMQARPFLDYALDSTDNEISKLEDNLIDDITNSLAN